MNHLLKILFIAILFSFNHYAVAEENAEGHNTAFDPLVMIAHHISDSHEWQVISYTNSHGEPVSISIPLPVIIFYKGQLHGFMSSAFAHGKAIVKKGTTNFKLYHNKIYVTDEEGRIALDEENHPINEQPLDLSITKNVASMWLSIVLILWLFISSARKYTTIPSKPSGKQSFLEPLILFIRDDVAIMQIGKEKADKYLPYLLTLFFFIWINNLIGLVPFFPGASNLTGNISVTLVLSVLTFLITSFSGSKTYWKHILLAPGVPGWVKIFLVPVELVGIFTKPFALMIRLLANITAGHIIILSLFAIVFVMKSYYIAPVSILMGLVMYLLEFLVAALQAYIFTLLTALFIGMAVHEEEH